MIIDQPEQSFEDFSLGLSPNRQLLAGKLTEKAWFRNTSLELQKQILGLPQDFEGFVYDLSERPDTFFDTTVLSLKKLLVGSYLVTSIFEVELKKTQKTTTYEYVSWKNGRRPGIKGIMFVEYDGEIKYFILENKEKFAISDKIFDSVGGLIQFTGSSLINLPEQFEKEITGLLGIDTLKISQFIDLGKVFPDAGMANHHVSLFAAIIDGTGSKILKDLDGEKQKKDIQLIPIERLQDYIICNDDSFFLAAISRLIAKGIIKLQS